MSLPLDIPSSRMALHRRRAEFVDPEVERRFVHHFLSERNAQLQASLLFAAVFYVVFGATDLAALGSTSTAWTLVVLRVLVALVAVGGHVAIARWPDSLTVSVRAASSLLVTALGVFMVLCWYQPAALAWNAMSMALIVMAAYVYFPNRFTHAVAIGVGSSVFFAGMLLVQGLLGPDDLLTLVLLLVLGNALGFITARRIHIAQRRQFRSALLQQQMAYRDPLTGCYNRRVLQKGMLEAELRRVRRYGSPLSVLICDIDHFKLINDSHGHAAGDQVLKDFSALVLSMTRDTIDRVIRYGGEEFLVVLPQTDALGAHAMAHRIRLAFERSTSTTDKGLPVRATASFGLATVRPGPGGALISSEALIGEADAQLYEAKRNGRNDVRGVIVGG